MLLRRRYLLTGHNQRGNYKGRAAKHFLAQLMTNRVLNLFDHACKKYSDFLLKENPATWSKLLSNELG